MSLRTLVLAATASLSLSACADPYGYSGVGVGYGAGWGSGWGYNDGFYGGGSPYWGWYGDYYYPGTGRFVYDSWRRPHRWNSGQRAYWEGRRRDWRGDRRGFRPNWGGFDRGGRHWRDDRGGRRGWRR